jgi:hypothetical protein
MPAAKGARRIDRRGHANENRRCVMVKLVQVSPTGPRNFISVDEDGVVWRGEIKTYKSGGEYIEWKTIPSEFPR